MSKVRKRHFRALSRIERARVALRLASDGRLRPVRELAALAGASPRGLVRWITEGRSGVYLDALYDRERGWLSAPGAVQRFLREWQRHRGERAG